MSNENQLTKFEQEFGLKVNEEGRIAVSSRVVADKYGKEHRNVLAKIDGFIKAIPEMGVLNFKQTPYVGENGETYREYLMDRQGFSILVNKFNGDDALRFTYEYTKAFEEMAEELEHRREQSKETIKALSEKDEKIQRKKMLEAYFGKRKTVKTFKFCTYEEFNGLLQLFEEHIGLLRDAEEKRAEYERFVNGLTQNRNNINPNDKMYMPKTTTYSYYIHEYVKKKGSSENKSYGQIIRYKDETIKEQKKEIVNLNPPMEEFMCFNVHPVSENYMYQPVQNDINSKLTLARTELYNNWIKTFPRDKAIPKDKLNVQWDKPVKIFIKVDCLEKFDTTNFIKAINDMVVNRIYEEDDQIVVDTKIQRNKVVENYKDGKIYVCIKNV